MRCGCGPIQRGLLVAAAVALFAVASCLPSVAPAPAPVPAPPVMWPLLETTAPSASAIRARVVVAKIDNQSAARPQSGLAQADVVYETLTEGGITRYAAIYQSKAPTRVGPIRSARLSDIAIVEQYRAILARIGADFVVEAAIRSQGASFGDMNAFSNPASYTRSSLRPAPHNLYADLPRLRQAAAAKGLPASVDPPSLQFGPMPSAPSTSGVRVSVPFSPVNHARWAWRSSIRLYQRTLNGSGAGDAGSRAPYEASNVVILFARMVRTKALDPAGNPTYEVVLTGSGKAILFRGGRRFDGVWSASTAAPPTLTSIGGGSLALAVGRTWFEVVPPGTRVVSQ